MHFSGWPTRYISARRKPLGVMQIVFFGGSYALYQFKDEVGSVMKKDFVPYSEKRAMEMALVKSREADESLFDKTEPQSATPSGSEKDMLSFLPSGPSSAS